MSDSPEKLWPAIRQFRKQLKDEFICGYDIEFANAAYMELEGDIELLTTKVKELEDWQAMAKNHYYQVKFLSDEVFKKF